MDIIPAIDLIEGKCVRLSQGDYDKKTVYNNDPLEVALAFEDNGMTRLHLVDLDGAKAQHIVNYKVLERITSKTSLIVDFGGGLKSDDDLRIAFECGAAMVTGGSIAVKSRDKFESWLKQYGGERIILGADVKDNKIAVTGWTESTQLDLMPFLDEYTQKGVKKVICTDISRDGMLTGPSVELYKDIMSRFPDMYLVASGGVSSVKDLYELSEAGIPAVVFGKAFYEGRITFKELSEFIK